MLTQSVFDGFVEERNKWPKELLIKDFTFTHLAYKAQLFLKMHLKHGHGLRLDRTLLHDSGCGTHWDSIVCAWFGDYIYIQQKTIVFITK